MSKPLVSVIIPVYNVEQYLPQCIESLVNQSLSPIELIFVNDCSPDNSLDVLKRYKSEYEQIKIIDSKVNLKQGGARNLGMKAASAKYIGFVDPDDYVSVDMFKTLFDAIESRQTDAVFIQYSAVSVGDVFNKEVKGGKPLISWSNHLREMQDKQISQTEKERFLIEPIGGVGCGLYKKEMILGNHLMFPEGLRFEDNYWGTMLRTYIDSFHLVDEVEYYYRQNPKSTMHSRNQDYIKDRRPIENKLLLDAKEKNIYEKYKEAWEYIYITRYAFSTYFLYVSRNDRRDNAFLKKLFSDLTKEFPNWEKNRFYCEKTPIVIRSINKMVYYAPQLSGKIISIVCKAKRLVKK